MKRRHNSTSPIPADTQWAALPAGDRARIMGAAAGLTSSDLNVYAVMATQGNGAGRRIFTSNRQIATIAGYSRQEVIRAQKRLEAAMFIRRVKPSKGGITDDGRANPTNTWAVFLPASPPIIEETTVNGRVLRASRVPPKSSRRVALYGSRHPVTRGYTSAKADPVTDHEARCNER